MTNKTTEFRPERIRLEVSTACQLRCPSCPTAQGIVGEKLGTSMLTLDAFKRVIDENPWVRFIELSNYGEAFLNPNLLPMLQYADEHGVWLSVLNGANLNNVRPEVLEGVVKHRMWAILCSIDGASQESYEQYRVRGHLDTVIANIEKINFFKQEYGSEYPKLIWQFVVFGHNEHELDKAGKMAADLGMTFLPKMNWDASFSPVRDVQTVRLKTGLAAHSEREYAEKNPGRVNAWHEALCGALWHRPQVNVDGRLLGCGINYWGDFGNAFTEGLEAALDGEKMQHARAMLMGEAPPRDDIPCTSCSYYKEMARHRRYFTAEDMKTGRYPFQIDVPAPKQPHTQQSPLGQQAPREPR